jgi:diacylglycerol O-acyltransferase / wax synthase
VPEPLSPADSASLQSEQGPVNMAVAGAIVLEGGKTLNYDTVVERVRERLHLVPRFRQRIEDTPLGLAGPMWVDDNHFDLTWHVRRAALAEPGGDAELASFVAQEMSRRLDRSRPLWEMHVISGLAGGRLGLLVKMHHALVDGVAAVAVGALLFDPTPEPLEIPAPERPWSPERFDRRHHFTRLARSPLQRAQKLMLDSATRALDTSPRRAAEDLRRATGLAGEIARQRPQAPMTPLNVPISPNRRFAIAHVPLVSLKAAGRAAGGTVNDTLLAVVAGMLRRYLDAAPPGVGRGAPVALVPVSVRREGDQDAGNRISTVFVDLPVDVEAPLDRVRAINATMAELKDSSAVAAGAIIAGATGWTPPLLSAAVVRAMSSVRAFNLVVSNVPGPQQPFYLAGSRLLEVYPVVPLNPSNQGLTVGIVSYDGEVFFGMLADRNLDPPLDVAADALGEALGEILDLAG